MPPASAFVNVMLDTVRKELAAADVEIVADLAPDDPTNVPLQLQQFSQAVALKPDVIFFIPLAGEPSVDAVKAAGEAGIPVIAMQSVVDSEYAVSVTGNSVLQAMKAGASTLKRHWRTGNVLRVTGIPGISTELYAEDGFQNVLELCPDVSIAGEVTGFFEATTAQTATLQYLATNPAGVDAVLQSGTMGLGVLNAFEESGLEVPPIADIGRNPRFRKLGSAEHRLPVCWLHDSHGEAVASFCRHRSSHPQGRRAEDQPVCQRPLHCRPVES